MNSYHTHISSNIEEQRTSLALQLAQRTYQDMSELNLPQNQRPFFNSSNPFLSDGFYDFVTVINNKVISEIDSPTKITCDCKSIVNNNIGAKYSMIEIRKGPASNEKLANDCGMLSYEG
jgi:hypothetical protein